VDEQHHGVLRRFRSFGHLLADEELDPGVDRVDVVVAGEDLRRRGSGERNGECREREQNGLHAWPPEGRRTLPNFARRR